MAVRFGDLYAAGFAMVGQASQKFGDASCARRIPSSISMRTDADLWSAWPPSMPCWSDIKPKPTPRFRSRCRTAITVISMSASDRTAGSLLCCKRVPHLSKITRPQVSSCRKMLNCSGSLVMESDRCLLGFSALAQDGDAYCKHPPSSRLQRGCPTCGSRFAHHECKRRMLRALIEPEGTIQYETLRNETKRNSIGY